MSWKFDANAFKNLEKKLTNTFEISSERIKNITDLCEEMSSIVSSQDSEVGIKWKSIASMVLQIQKLLKEVYTNATKELDTYINNTLENEKLAQEELNKLDGYLNDLSSITASLLSLAGYGFSVPNFAPNIQTKYGVTPSPIDVQTKYGVTPSPIDVQTKYGVTPSPIDVQTKYGVRPNPIDVQTKYGVRPNPIDVQTKYGVIPSPINEIQTKYGVKPIGYPTLESATKSIYENNN